MAELQKNMVYIEKEHYEEAEFMSRNFVNPELKNRAYLNVLGSEVMMNYLKSEGIDVEDLHNLHSISKILEKYDIADILLSNIHIDIRVVFNRNQLFIPKSHFKNEITPDVYVFVIFSEDYKTAEILGYCETSAIDKKKANNDYYFVSIDQLTSVEKLSQYIKNFVGKTKHEITEEEMLRGRQLSVALADHNITKVEEKELIELLLISDSLRESVLEFDNFETLAYSAVPEVAKYINENVSQIASSVTETFDIVEENAENTSDAELSEDDIVDETLEELNIEDSIGDNMLEDGVGAEELPKISEELVQNSRQQNIEVEITNKEILDDNIQEPELSMSEIELAPIEEMSINSELSVDDILDQTIASIDEPQVKEKNSTPKPEIEPEDKDESISKVAGEVTGAAVAGAAIAGMAAAEATTMGVAGAAASVGAMKLAGVAGDIITEVVNTNLNKQSENLNKIDFANVGDTPEAIEMSEEAKLMGDLSVNSKAEETLQNEKSEEFVPKDMSQLGKVDTIASETKEQIFVQETVDMSNMETVENDLYQEETDSGVEIGTLTDIEAVKRKEEELTEAHILSESEVVDLPDSAGFTISEDGTSSFDDMMSEEKFPPKEDTDNLVDIKPLVDDDNFVGSLNFDEIVENVSLEANSKTDSNITLDDVENSIDKLMALEAMGETIEEPIEEAKIETQKVSSEAIDSIDEIALSEDLVPLEDISLEEEVSLAQDLKPIDEAVNVEPLEEHVEKVSFESIEPLDVVEEQTLEEPLTTLDSIEEPVEDFQAVAEEQKIEDITPVTEETLIAETSDAIDTIMLEELADAETLKDDNIVEEITDVSDENEEQKEKQSEVQDEISEEQMVEDTTVSDGLPSELYDESSLKTGVEENPPQETVPEEMSIEDFEQIVSDDNTQVQEDASLDDFFGMDQENPAEEAIETDSTASIDELITEPEVAPVSSVINAVDNSTIISDRTFKPGEVPIDINDVVPAELAGPESLGELYNSDSPMAGEALLKNPGRMSNSENQQGKSPVGVVLGFVGVLIILAIVGAVGFGVAKMFKAPKEEAPQPITDEALPVQSPAPEVSNNPNSLDINPNNVVSMDNNTNALASTAGTTSSQSATAARTTGTATAFVDIKKLSWEVPDYISADASFKQYFQSSGKSLKNGLTADLLLATDYIYSSPVKISVTFDKEGNFKNSQIINSSGSTQIDNIVLQTVNQTFKALKAPHSVGNDESTTAILKIYF